MQREIVSASSGLCERDDVSSEPCSQQRHWGATVLTLGAPTQWRNASATFATLLVLPLIMGLYFIFLAKVKNNICIAIHENVLSKTKRSTSFSFSLFNLLVFINRLLTVPCTSNYRERPINL